MRASNRSHWQHNDIVGFHLRIAATLSNQWGPLLTAEGAKRYLELELIRKDLNRGLLSGLDGSVSRARDQASLGVAARGLAASAICAALLKAPFPL